MEAVPCTAKELAEKSGLSASAISRYRAGKRMPGGEDELKAIIDGLAQLSAGRFDDKKVEEMKDAFRSSLPNLCIDKFIFAEKFSRIINDISVNRKKLAESVGYDPSFLSKMINGDRVPADYYSFAANVADHIVSVYDNGDISRALSNVTSIKEAADKETLIKAIADWLLSPEEDVKNLSGKSGMESFLKSLDDFDLNDYMKRIHFDKIPVPKSPIHQKNSKSFFGAEGMKKAEVEFLKRTVLSSSTEPVWMYSSLPMEEVAADEKFAKKWMIGLAMVLKKGLHMHIIHDTSRPFEEMMLGIESWIPLYMTGLIHPYYIKQIPDKDFDHMIRISGACAMSGECSGKDLKSALFYITSDEAGMEGMNIRKDYWFDMALPLMDIYREDRNEEYLKVLKKESSKNEPRIPKESENHFFKNMNIKLFGNECVIISKNNDPPVNLVIRQPQLVDAFIKAIE